VPSCKRMQKTSAFARPSISMQSLRERADTRNFYDTWLVHSIRLPGFMPA
jgi:hypothetical protein